MPTLKPTFIISVDVELLWGYLDHPTNSTVALLCRDLSNGRAAIHSLLQLTERYNIPATWAVVGHLFLDQCQGHHGILSTARQLQDPGTDSQRAPLYYGKDIVEEILSTPIEHEIGYHSFSHTVFSGCSHETAEAEIREGVRLAKELGITLKSFVFPENKVGHVDILKQNGFLIYRGAGRGHWKAHQKFPIRKVNGAIDKILATPVKPEWRAGIWELPSSMQFTEAQIPFSLLFRSKLGVHQAMLSSKVFHIWLHSHDLLRHPSTLQYLRKLLECVDKNRSAGRLQVLTMGGLASYLSGGSELEK